MLCSILLLLAQPSLAQSLKVAKPVQTQSQWISFAPPDEEITAMLPARPTIRTYPIYISPNTAKYGSNPNSNYEPLLAHHEYGGYGDGLVFIIHSFKAEHPAKLSEGLNLIKETDLPHQTKIGDVTADDFHTIVPNLYAAYTKRTLRFI